MAEIFRPVYTATDPKTGKKIRRKSPTWWISYYDPNGVRHKVKDYTDRAATVARATELERRAARLDAGLVDATDEHAKRPLAEHAVDFRRYLAAKGNTADYVALMFGRLSAILDGCQFVKIGDIQASAVVEFLGTLRGQGKSTKTTNDYLSAVKGFTRVRHGLPGFRIGQHDAGIVQLRRRDADGNRASIMHQEQKAGRATIAAKRGQGDWRISGGEACGRSHLAWEVAT